jgi:enolase-phosphatase E1
VKFRDVKFILTDIEGTTTSVSFVYDQLFPYFRENYKGLLDMKGREEVKELFKATKHLSMQLEDLEIHSDEEVLETLHRWSVEDKKITPLKTAQGLIWKAAYESGAIKGHVYPDVAGKLEKWKNNKVELGVFSSGSIAAQKLLFKNSEFGDLAKLFSYFFDTTTGQKKDKETYTKIASEINQDPKNILFLSDINAELEAAQAVDFQCCQLLRPKTISNWDNYAHSFDDIDLI